MKKQIIPIPRASEALVCALMEKGILYADENGIHVTEKQASAPTKAGDLK